MYQRVSLLGLVGLFAVSCALEVDDEIDHSQSRIVSGSHALSYVGKQSNITDFRGYGQHLYYFPLFGLSAPESARRTDDRDVYHQGVFRQFEHHQLLSLSTRTFSPDAYGSPLGVKARGGYANWPVFTLPNGQTGRSGAIYDDATLDGNSNNTVNQIITLYNQPRDFCLNIITDNTGGQNNPDRRLEARLDSGGTQIDYNLAGHPDYTFDGTPDMYTFLYEGMNDDERIKIRLSTNATSDGRGAGFGGIMVSDVSTCNGCTPDCSGLECGDNGCGGSCGTCGGGDVCVGGTCSCTPDCSGLACGDDGCGGSCGTCGGGDTCAGGVCVPPSTGVTMGAWHGFSTGPYSHPKAAGSKRLLVFTAHGRDKRYHYATSVSYGNRAMHKLVDRTHCDGRCLHSSMWYLLDADVGAASGTNFSVNWSRHPSDRGYDSVFFTGVNQSAPFGDWDSGATSSSAVYCHANVVETGHVHIYSASHKNQHNYTPLGGFTEDAEYNMGSEGRAAVGHLNGTGASVNPGVSMVANPQTIVCAEIQD